MVFVPDDQKLLQAPIPELLHRELKMLAASKGWTLKQLLRNVLSCTRELLEADAVPDLGRIPSDLPELDEDEEIEP
jgi:hypothetical protein